MKQHQLFARSRRQLTLWYAGILAGILGLCGFLAYEAIAHAHRITIDRELKSVAGALHNSLEPVLKQPGVLDPAATHFLPDLCLATALCSQSDRPLYPIGVIERGMYSLQLFDLSGRLVAVAGTHAQELPSSPNPQQWQTLPGKNGIRYRQITLPLHDRDEQLWGTLQVGRSLEDFDRYVSAIAWILLLGLPLALVLAIASGWWLAGKAMQPIYQSYGQMQQFTADAAHELRTPLAAIRATVESTLMLPKLAEGEARDTLRTIKRQNLRLSHLVADLLLLCRLDGQQSSPQKTQAEVLLEELASDVVEEFAALALAAEVTLNVELLSPPPFKVMGSSEQLYRLVSNLVANAIQYTPSGGSVCLSLERDKPNEIALSVRDTGVGIPIAEQPHIFDRFYRVDKARSRDRSGSGLGLAIACAIAQLHNGTIQLKSQIPQGSTFIVRLPLSP